MNMKTIVFDWSTALQPGRVWYIKLCSQVIIPYYYYKSHKPDEN